MRANMTRTAFMTFAAIVVSAALTPDASRAYTDNYGIDCPNDIYCLEANPGHNWVEGKTQNWGENGNGQGYPAELCLKIVSTKSGTGHYWCSGSYYPPQKPGSNYGVFGVGKIQEKTGLPYPYYGYTLQYNIYGPSQWTWGWWWSP